VSSHLDALRDADDDGDGGGGGDEWVATVDPSSKKTYYYNATTRETSWSKPPAAPAPAAGKVSRNSAAVVRRLGACFVEGLAWCLAYYVKGCVDWRWFFPCHYCPMLSDVTDVAGALAGAAFEVGRPLRPLEQLMSCLPPLSAQLLPRPHRKLMLEATSPIKEFYPDDFVVDMDGKRNPWEGVNLLPFIEVGRLLDAVAAHCDEGALGADERKRAAFGRSLVFTADPAKVAAPARGGVLGGDDADEGPDASGVRVADEFPGVAEPWLVYGPPLVATLRDACKAAMPGFPSLHALPLVGANLKPLRLDCFGTPSRYETLSIVLPRSEGGDLAPAVAAQLLGKSVFVNWPMTHEARLECVVGGGCEYRTNGSVVLRRSLDAKEASKRAAEAALFSSRALAGGGKVGDGGVDVGNVDVVLGARLLQGLARDARTGALFKVFGKDETLVPLQLAMSSPPHAHVVDERFAETAPVASSGRFGVGSRVLITRGPRRGAVGVVAACDDLRNTVTLDAPREDPEPQFGVGIASALGDKFASQKLAASELGLREDVLEALVGTVVVDDAEAGVTYDVGLRLVVENSTFVALGYVRGMAAADETADDAWARGGDAVAEAGSRTMAKTRGPWEYSARGIRLVAAYAKRWPAVVDAVAERLAGKLDPKKDFDDDGHLKFAGAAHLFGHDGPDNALLDVCKWLAALPTALSARVPVTTRAMSADAVAAVQRAAAKRAAIRAAQNAGEDRLELDAGDVLAERELDAARTSAAARLVSLDAARPPRLGERVAASNVDVIGAPFGHRGTVVATHAHSRSVDVVFDEPFVGGTSLQGACDNFRGLLCPWAALLPIKAPVDDAPPPPAAATKARRGASPPPAARAATKAPSKLRNNRLAKGPDGTIGFAASWSAGRRRAAKKPAKKSKAPAPTPPPPRPFGGAAPAAAAPPPPPTTWLAPPPALKAPPRAAANPPPRAAANPPPRAAANPPPRAAANPESPGKLAPVLPDWLADESHPEFADAALASPPRPPPAPTAILRRGDAPPPPVAPAAAPAPPPAPPSAVSAAAAGLSGSRKDRRAAAVAARAAAPPPAPAVLAPLPPGAPPPPAPAVLAPPPPGAPPPPSAVEAWSASTDDRLAALEARLRASPGAPAPAPAPKPAPKPRPAPAAAKVGFSYGFAAPPAALAAAPGAAAGFKYVPMPGAAAKRVPRKPRPAGGPALMLPTQLLGKAPAAAFAKPPPPPPPPPPEAAGPEAETPAAAPAPDAAAPAPDAAPAPEDATKTLDEYEKPTVDVAMPTPRGAVDLAPAPAPAEPEAGAPKKKLSVFDRARAAMRGKEGN